MVKATLRSAVLLALLAVGMLAVSMPSFAEVQNVKVGGDVTVRAFFRKNLDLLDNNPSAAGGNSPAQTDLDGDNFIQQTTGINISADLTQNVSGHIRLANERTWGTTGLSNGDLDLSQGYVKVKELFFSPLTLTVGTQPITWGRGFVLGSNLIPSILTNGDDRNQSITANEFTDFTAFDAIRLQADLSGSGAVSLPLMVDAVYIKDQERITSSPDDKNFIGLNLGTHMDAMSSEFETYFLNKTDKSPGGIGVTAGKDTSVSTYGIRGSLKPVEGAYVYGELAYQWGTRDTDPSGIVATADRQQAWAANLGAEYTLSGVPTTPKVGAEWIFFSGNNVDGAAAGWDPMARGYFTTALREFQTASTVVGFYPNRQTGTTSAATNQHQLSLYGSFKPIEDLTVAPRLSWFILDAGAINAPGGANQRHHFAGTEWDTQVNYAYTEDVSFGLIYALFLPGPVYREPSNATTGNDAAQELISTVSVKF